MNVRRGDIVLLDFPYPSGVGAKLRPRLVVQNDRDNGRLTTTVVVQITTTTHRSQEPTQVLVEIGTVEGRQSGLAFDSVVNCINIVTLDRNRVKRRLGNLPVALMQMVDEALKAEFEIP